MRRFALIMVGLLLAGHVHAEGITFFRASTAGPDVWAWEGAKVRIDDGMLCVREGNRSGSSGSAFVDNQYPYFADGRVSYSVDSISGGNYSLQVMFFRDGEYIGSTDLVRRATSVTTGGVILSDLQAPEGVDGISFKIWVADLEGSQLKLRDLIYTVPIEGREVMLDDEFVSSSAWTMDGLIWQASGPPPVVVLGDATFGSMLNKQRMVKSTGMTAAMYIPHVQAGVVTLQAVGFEGGTGEYIASADLIKNVGPGWHLVRLDEAGWPSHADEFELKLWLSGSPKTKASFGRLLVLK